MLSMAARRLQKRRWAPPNNSYFPVRFHEGELFSMVLRGTNLFGETSFHLYFFCTYLSLIVIVTLRKRIKWWNLNYIRHYKEKNSFDSVILFFFLSILIDWLTIILIGWHFLLHQLPSLSEGGQIVYSRYDVHHLHSSPFRLTDCSDRRNDTNTDKKKTILLETV